MLKDISEKTGYTYQMVEDVYFHQFEFVAKEMEIGERGNAPSYKNILLKHFGSFLSNEKHINKFKEIEEKRNDRTILQGE